MVRVSRSSPPHCNPMPTGRLDSYRVDGKGLSYTCDGVVAKDDNGRRVTPKSDPKHWQQRCQDAWSKAVATDDYSKVAIFGFLTDVNTGKPLVQKAGDPIPGADYLTSTSVEIPGVRGMEQRRWIDAAQIPYVVLPPNFVRKFAVNGALALVYRPKTDTIAFAVYGDGGDFGEGSVKLHNLLGNDPIVIRGGVRRAKQSIDDAVVTLVLPINDTKVESDIRSWTERIESEGKKAVDDLGGQDAVRSCLRRLTGSPQLN